MEERRVMAATFGDAESQARVPNYPRKPVDDSLGCALLPAALGLLSTAEQAELGLTAAHQLLPLWLAECPGDDRLTNLLRVAWGFLHGEACMEELREHWEHAESADRYVQQLRDAEHQERMEAILWGCLEATGFHQREAWKPAGPLSSIYKLDANNSMGHLRGDMLVSRALLTPSTTAVFDHSVEQALLRSHHIA